MTQLAFVCESACSLLKCVFLHQSCTNVAHCKDRAGFHAISLDIKSASSSLKILSIVWFQGHHHGSAHHHRACGHDNHHHSYHDHNHSSALHYQVHVHVTIIVVVVNMTTSIKCASSLRSWHHNHNHWKQFRTANLPHYHFLIGMIIILNRDRLRCMHASQCPQSFHSISVFTIETCASIPSSTLSCFCTAIVWRRTQT